MALIRPFPCVILSVLSTVRSAHRFLPPQAAAGGFQPLAKSMSDIDIQLRNGDLKCSVCVKPATSAVGLSFFCDEHKPLGDEPDKCETCNVPCVGKPLAYGSLSVVLCAGCYAKEAPAVLVVCIKCDKVFGDDDMVSFKEWNPDDADERQPKCIPCLAKDQATPCHVCESVSKDADINICET